MFYSVLVTTSIASRKKGKEVGVFQVRLHAPSSSVAATLARLHISERYNVRAVRVFPIGG